MEVKNYWMKLIILAFYFILVFIVSRILDLVLWYHHGYLPNALVDPIVLNVRQLKLLLDSRGVSYSGVLEKQQLVELLNDSAHVVHSEVNELSMFSNSTERLTSHPPPSSVFTGGSHFNEKVEDTKDSVWLVQVIPAGQMQHEPLLDDYSWRYLKHHLASFAVQTGVFDCALDRDLCNRRNWLEPILLLALPRGNRPKDHVVIRTSNTPKVHMIIKWVKEQLSSRVEKISSLSQLEEDWLSPTKTDEGVRVILFSHLLHTPLFFAALSIKFTGRIKFGIFSLKKDDATSDSNIRKHLSRQHRITSMPTYLVLTPTGKHTYGHLPAEHHNLFHMNLFLKLVLPEMNDVFMVGLVLTNMLAVIDMCQLHGSSSWLYLIRASFLVITYNLFLFMSSLVLYNLSLPLPTSYLLTLLHWFNFSLPGALLRSDLLTLYRNPALFLVSFVLYGFLTAKLFRYPETSWYEWDLFPFGNSFIVNSLFRPSETPSRHFVSDVNFDLRFEQLVISRTPRVFNVPNLWLQVPPRVDYISDLPVFEFRGWRDCPHKQVDKEMEEVEREMALVESVMDGESPSLLRRREVVKDGDAGSRDVLSLRRNETENNSTETENISLNGGNNSLETENNSAETGNNSAETGNNVFPLRGNGLCETVVSSLRDSRVLTENTIGLQLRETRLSGERFSEGRNGVNESRLSRSGDNTRNIGGETCRDSRLLSERLSPATKTVNDSEYNRPSKVCKLNSVRDSVNGTNNTLSNNGLVSESNSMRNIVEDTSSLPRGAMNSEAKSCSLSASDRIPLNAGVSDESMLPTTSGVSTNKVMSDDWVSSSGAPSQQEFGNGNTQTVGTRGLSKLSRPPVDSSSSEVHKRLPCDSMSLVSGSSGNDLPHSSEIGEIRSSKDMFRFQENSISSDSSHGGAISDDMSTSNNSMRVGGISSDEMSRSNKIISNGSTSSHKPQSSDRHRDNPIPSCGNVRLRKILSSRDPSDNLSSRNNHSNGENHQIVASSETLTRHPGGRNSNYAAPSQESCNHASPSGQSCNHSSPSGESCNHSSPSGESCNYASPSGENCNYLECRLIRVVDCAICLEAYSLRGSVLMALPCAHHFHKSCVLAWLRRGNAQCPVCRWPAYKQKYEFSY